MIRAVLDNNIIISGVFWDKIPEQVYRLASSQYILVTSAELCKELRDVLGRQKFSGIFTATNRTPDQVYNAYTKTAELITSGDVPPGAVRDNDDRPVLACAVGGKADYIVTACS